MIAIDFATNVGVNVEGRLHLDRLHMEVSVQGHLAEIKVLVGDRSAGTLAVCV